MSREMSQKMTHKMSRKMSRLVKFYLVKKVVLISRKLKLLHMIAVFSSIFFTSKAQLHYSRKLETRKAENVSTFLKRPFGFGGIRWLYPCIKDTLGYIP